MMSDGKKVLGNLVQLNERNSFETREREHAECDDRL